MVISNRYDVITTEIINMANICDPDFERYIFEKLGIPNATNNGDYLLASLYSVDILYRINEVIHHNSSIVDFKNIILYTLYKFFTISDIGINYVALNYLSENSESVIYTFLTNNWEIPFYQFIISTCDYSGNFMGYLDLIANCHYKSSYISQKKALSLLKLLMMADLKQQHFILHNYYYKYCDFIHTMITNELAALYYGAYAFMIPLVEKIPLIIDLYFKLPMFKAYINELFTNIIAYVSPSKIFIYGIINNMRRIIILNRYNEHNLHMSNDIQVFLNEQSKTFRLIIENDSFANIQSSQHPDLHYFTSIYKEINSIDNMLNNLRI